MFDENAEALKYLNTDSAAVRLEVAQRLTDEIVRLRERLLKYECDHPRDKIKIDVPCEVCGLCGEVFK